MNKKSNFFIIGYLLFLISSVLISCDDCGGSYSKYNFTSFAWDTSSIELTDNYYQSTAISNETVNFDKFAIKIEPVLEYYSSNRKFNLLQTVYACSPVDPTTDDKITNIEIITNTNFNATHSAGSDISNYFDVGLIGNTFDIVSVAQFVNGEYKELHHFFFLLKNAPETDGEMSFTVKITLDGKTLDYVEFTTDTITITNN